jgi:CheY-like chemotaxis protein
LATRAFFVALPIADLDSLGQYARSQFEQWLSGARTCPRIPAPITAGVGVGILLVLACLTLLLMRARRQNRKFREQLDNLLALRKAIESTDRANAEFIACMVPQIRTPMNAIVGFIDLALKADLDPNLREHLDTVRTSADWLMHLENDALEFSCIGTEGLPLDNVPFSISECILSAMKIVEREATAKKLITGYKIDPQLPEVVRGDPTRFRHVIFNLLDYVVKKTSSGSILLAAALESDSADNVLVRVAITDTGVGIPPAKRSLILEPFRHADVSAALRSDPAGFGLVISRRLVDLMGGTMEFRSRAGEDSTLDFTIRFQRQTPAKRTEAPARAHKGPELKTLSILVAEDSAVNRRLISKVLESAGHRVWTATNGKEAADTFQTEGFDLIFMDVEMPDMDGLEATRAIRAAEAPNLRVPIYALTAHALPDDRDRCLAAGMDGFITKPIVMDDVMELVSTVAACVVAGPANVNEPPTAMDADSENIATEAAFHVISRESVEEETAVASDIPEQTASDYSGANLDEDSFAAEQILRNLEDLVLNNAGGVARAETNGFFGTIVPAAEVNTEEASDVAIDKPATLFIEGSDVLPERNQSAEILSRPAAIEPPSYSSVNSDESSFASEEILPDLESLVLDASQAARTETNGFFRAIVPAPEVDIKDAFDVAIGPPVTLLVRDSDVSQERNQSAEILRVRAAIEASSGDSDDGDPETDARLSVPTGLALLEAVSQESGPAPAVVKDPFEQARKSLSKSSFGIRVVHNDGDPTDRNLI